MYQVMLKSKSKIVYSKAFELFEDAGNNAVDYMVAFGVFSNISAKFCAVKNFNYKRAVQINLMPRYTGDSYSVTIKPMEQVG